MGLISGMEGWFNIKKSINVTHHINTLKIENHMILLIDAEKNNQQNLTPIHDKNSKLKGIEESFLNLIKTIYKKPTANIILNGERLEAFPLR